MTPRPARMALVGLGTLAFALALAASPAPGQVPAPYVKDPTRSGVVFRQMPVAVRLPHDEDRDAFLGTRYEEESQGHWRNSYKDGGLYGRCLPADCTATVYPYFTGTPADSLRPDCVPHHRVARWWTNALQPFRPVGMYYDRGVFAPIHDLDPLVTGPGPFPWPVFFKRPLGG